MRGGERMSVNWAETLMANIWSKGNSYKKSRWSVARDVRSGIMYVYDNEKCTKKSQKIKQKKLKSVKLQKRSYA